MEQGQRRGIAAALSILILAQSPTLSVPARAGGLDDGARGREALLAGRPGEAARLLTRAILFGRLDVRTLAITLSLRAEAYLEQGQTALALDDVNQSLKLGDTPDARLARARILIAGSRLDDAIADLDQALALGARESEVLALRGHANLHAGRLDEAVQDLDRAIALDPRSGFAYRTRGHAFLDRDQADRAIADETRAIALDPRDGEARRLRADAYRYHLRDLGRAIADYTAALAIDPADSAARTSRAAAYEAQGRWAEAAADYDVWLRQNPQGPFGYWARGRLNLLRGRPAAAAADLARAVGLKPADPYDVLWLHLARLKARQDDAAELRANAARADRTLWPGLLLDHLTGQAEAAAVLSRAQEAEGAAGAQQLCEAQMVLGLEALAHGRKADGRGRLQAAARACAPGSLEARLVRAELRPGRPAARRGR